MDLLMNATQLFINATHVTASVFFQCSYHNTSDPNFREPVIECPEPLPFENKYGCFSIFRPIPSVLKMDPRDQFNLPTNFFRIIQQGCWPSTANVVSLCERSGCYDDVYDMGEKDTFFCCCDTPMCNLDVTIAKRIPLVTSTTPFSEPEHTLNLSWPLMIFIVCMLFTIIFHCVVGIHQLKKWLDRRAHVKQENTEDEESGSSDSGIMETKNIMDRVEGKFRQLRSSLRSKSNEGPRTHFIKKFTGRKQFMNDMNNLRKNSSNVHLNQQLLSNETRPGEYRLITEQPDITLRDHIKDNVIPSGEAVRLIDQCMDALSYLNNNTRPEKSTKPRIFLRSISSESLLIKTNPADNKPCIVVSDFTDAIACHTDTDVEALGKQRVGDVRYLSPEILNGVVEFTMDAYSKMDVYSMSLVCWEILHRSKCFDNDPVPPYQLPYEEEAGLKPTRDQMINLVIEQGRRPESRPALLQNIHTKNALILLMGGWEHESVIRSSPNQISLKINSTMKKIESDYPEPQWIALCAETHRFYPTHTLRNDTIINMDN